MSRSCETGSASVDEAFSEVAPMQKKLVVSELQNAYPKNAKTYPGNIKSVQNTYCQ